MTELAIVSRKQLVVKIETAVALALSAWIVFLHVTFYLHAGGLWRDEASSVGLALRPTFGQMWADLAFDPFPVLYFALLRTWIGVGFSSDAHIRLLGMSIGILTVVAFWWSSKLVNKDSPPLIPLALFCLNPVALQSGDSARPYGLSVFILIICYTFAWKMTDNAAHKKSSLAIMIGIAVICVQVSFTNVFLLSGMCLAGIVAALVCGKRRRAVLFSIAGFTAVTSLALYLHGIQRVRDWSVLLAGSVSIAGVMKSLFDTLTTNSLLPACLALFVGAIAIVASLRSWLREDSSSKSAIIYSVVTSFLSVVAITIFFIATRKPPDPRYFIGLLVVICLSLQQMAGRIGSWFFRTLLLAGCIGAVVTLLPASAITARMPMTNCPDVASRVAESATQDDLVIVTAFYYAVSFERYYQGKASWMSLPEIADHSIHRWDLMKDMMMQRDPLVGLLAQMESTLRGGHNVYLVGTLPAADSAQPEPLPPAPDSDYGWELAHYQENWQARLSYVIEHHATSGHNLLPAGSVDRASREVIGAYVVSGWRDTDAN